MKTVLNDIRIERTVLGCLQIQFQFRLEGTNETTTWQMPFKIGDQFGHVVNDIHQCAELISKGLSDREHYKSEVFAQLLKRDCADRRGDPA